jgi:hypothetical protein
MVQAASLNQQRIMEDGFLIGDLRDIIKARGSDFTFRPPRHSSKRGVEIPRLWSPAFGFVTGNISESAVMLTCWAWIWG